MLLQRALPHLTHEDICWRLHFTIKVSQETHQDAARLAILSKGDCHHDDADEALDRATAFAEAAFMAPAYRSAQKVVKKRGAKTRRAP